MTDTRTSAAEELQYGHYAPLMRRVSQAAVALQQAMDEVNDLGRDSRSGDDATAPVSQDGWVDGESPHTRMLGELYGRVAGLAQPVLEGHRALGIELATGWHRFRQPADSIPTRRPVVDAPQA